ncbi:hypothetical protein [Yinghuangia seranimata]|uniref:hypothetical protein n=1 Tax=Yinghuangia seranimata TaxID=408067 RepID=UPI00248B2EBA|nr:hypothetical protein [Yinghuangia seranimata]MDI2127148.1 hypothetical protein [Yinghuangia seranimata]
MEADGSGGSLRAWCGEASGDAGSGLVGLAAAVRHGADSDPGIELAAYAEELACGVRAVRGPTAGPQAAAAVEVLERTRFAVLTEDNSAAVVLVDAGRLDRAGSAVLAVADVVVLVARGGVDAMGHVAGRIEQVQASAAVVDLVVVGPSPYEPAEVEAAFGIGRVHAWPWDPSGVQALVEGRRGWRRSGLQKAARALAEDLCWRQDTGQLGAPRGRLGQIRSVGGGVPDEVRPGPVAPRGAGGVP